VATPDEERTSENAARARAELDVSFGVWAKSLATVHVSLRLWSRERHPEGDGRDLKDGMHLAFPDAPTADIRYKWDTPEGALAGMLGPGKVKVGNQKIIVTVDPTDISRFVAIPKPSRSSDIKDITIDEQTEALRLASEVFISGKKLGSAAHPSLNGQVTAFKEGVLAVGGVNWEEKRKVMYSLIRYPKWDTNFQETLPFECPASYTQQAMQ